MKKGELKASEKAKLGGLKNLTVLAKMVSRTCDTLRAWDKHNPELFEIVILGAVTKLSLEAIELQQRQEAAAQVRVAMDDFNVSNSGDV